MKTPYSVSYGNYLRHTYKCGVGGGNPGAAPEPLVRTDYEQEGFEFSMDLEDPSLVVLFVFVSRDGLNAPYTPSGITIPGFTKVVEAATTNGDDGFISWSSVWVAEAPAGLLEIEVVPTPGDGPYFLPFVVPFSYTGYNTGTPIGATLSAIAGPASGAWALNLSAPPLASSDVLTNIYGVNGNGGTMVPIVGAGWDQVIELQAPNNFSAMIQARTGSILQSANWLDTNSAGGGVWMEGAPLSVGVEVRAAA